MKKKARSKKPVRRLKKSKRPKTIVRKSKPKKVAAARSKKPKRRVKPGSKKKVIKKAAKKTKSIKVKVTAKKAAAKNLSGKPAPGKTAARSRKKTTPIPRLTPQENLERPFSIVESYMGTYDFKDIYSVLFVCTGNMCRSPIAEGVLQSRIKSEAAEMADKILVQSCGTYAMEGNKPSQHAVQVARQHGIDIAAVRSKSLNRVFIEQSDIIFALSIDHLNFILENFPTARNKTFLLKLFNKNRPITLSDSIPDPMGFSMEFYQKTFQEIRSAIDECYAPLMALVNRKLNSTDGSH